LCAIFWGWAVGILALLAANALGCANRRSRLGEGRMPEAGNAAVRRCGILFLLQVISHRSTFILNDQDSWPELMLMGEANAWHNPDPVHPFVMQRSVSMQEDSNPLRLQLCKINYSAYELLLPFSMTLYA